MARQDRRLFFSFENPNDTKSFQRELRRILIDKLTAAHQQNTAAVIRPPKKRDQ